jgi:hypothetical protein
MHPLPRRQAVFPLISLGRQIQSPRVMSANSPSYPTQNKLRNKPLEFCNRLQYSLHQRGQDPRLAAESVPVMYLNIVASKETSDRREPKATHFHAFEF